MPSGRLRLDVTQGSGAVMLEEGKRLPSLVTPAMSKPANESPSVEQTQAETLKGQHVVSPDSITQNSPLLTCSTQSSASVHPAHIIRSLRKTDIPSDETASKYSPTNTTVRDRSNKVESKYKLLPFSMIAAATSMGTSDEVHSKNKAQNKSRKTSRHHTDKCRALNRFKHFPDPELSKRIRRNDRKFLAKVEEYKHKKLITDCRCEEKSCSRFDDIFYRIGRVFRFITRLTCLLCCPPLPSSFFHKLAFWPPPRDYFFFYNPDSTKKKADAARTATIKLRKANREAMQFNNNRWRFGFEHECFAEILGVEGFIVETKRGNFLACVYVKSPHRNPRYTMLFSHPNGSDISDHLTGIPSLQETAAYLNCDIVAYDYSGYGISSGRPNETNLYADIEAVYDHLVKVRNIQNDSILFWGFSIGTAATVHLASKIDELPGVILFAPPTSIVRALCWKRCCCVRKEQPCNSKKKACSMDKFNTIEKIDKVSAPLLIIHGMEDEMVPIEHSQALFIHSNTTIPPLWIPDVGHNNLENSELLWTRVRDFVKNEARPALRTAEDEQELNSLQLLKRRKKKEHGSKATITSTKRHSSSNMKSSAKRRPNKRKQTK